MIFQFNCRTEDKDTISLASKEMREVNREGLHKSGRSLPVFSLDLNCLPCSVASSELSENKKTVQSPPGAIAKKRKRATTKDIAGISLEDIVKYFDLPIVEASRNLRIGLTVLKKKCRELGIPRWPHRKIKSLDSLIHNLQEEAVRQEQESEDAAMAVAKRKKMLEREKENIERKPFMEIQSETKKFRQDVFKRRHRARSLRSQGPVSDACQ